MGGSRAILLSEPPATCERLAPLTPPPGHQPQEGRIEMSKVSSGTGTEPWALWQGTWRQNMAARGKKEAVEEPSTDMRKQGGGDGDKATSSTSSVWDTFPSVKGSSSAVAGAARILRPRHTEVSRDGCYSAHELGEKIPKPTVPSSMAGLQQRLCRPQVGAGGAGLSWGEGRGCRGLHDLGQELKGGGYPTGLLRKHRPHSGQVTRSCGAVLGTAAT